MGGIIDDPVGEVAAELGEAAVQLGAVGEQSGGEGGRAEEIVAGSEVEVEEVAEIGREVGEWILLHSQLYQPLPPTVGKRSWDESPRPCERQNMKCRPARQTSVPRWGKWPSGEVASRGRYRSPGR